LWRSDLLTKTHAQKCLEKTRKEGFAKHTKKALSHIKKALQNTKKGFATHKKGIVKHTKKALREEDFLQCLFEFRHILSRT
jgi:hypothetical protein